MNGSSTIPPRWEPVQRAALTIGAVALVLCVAGALLVSSPAQMLRSYLFAYLFWLSMPLGCMAILMVHHLVGGGWGLVIRRILEASIRTVPLMAVLFVPFAWQLSALYVWARPEEVAADELLRHKQVYLNVPFFWIRAVIYFGSWIALAHLLNKWSRQQEIRPDSSIVRRLQLLSGPGLVIYGLTVTFASFDWAMSLDPHWFSTMYGILFVCSQVLAAFALSICTLVLLCRFKPLADVVTPDHLNDLGNFLLASVMLWAYMAFAQYLIVWSGNLPEEVTWYIGRQRGGWRGVALLLIVFHFALPFVLLLSRGVKRQAGNIIMVAGLLLVMRLIDNFWLVMPTFRPSLSVHWMDVLAPVGIGGLWIGAFIGQLKRRPLLPPAEPEPAGGALPAESV